MAGTILFRSVLALRDLPLDIAFVHYTQVVDGSALGRLTRLLEAPVDPGFADARLSRARAEALVPPETAAIYGQLCQIAEFVPSHSNN